MRAIKAFLGLILFMSIGTFLGVSFSVDTLAYNKRFPYFSDVEMSHKHFFAITDLMQKNIIKGYLDGTFKPDKPVSRAEALKILLLGSQISVPEISYEQKQKKIFSDIDMSQWYAKYVFEAKKQGIIKGRGDLGKFFPADTVNKAEALKMLLLVNNVKISNSSESYSVYNDVKSSDWFAGYFNEAYSRKLFTVSDDKKVYPAQNLTRGDLVEMMYRFQKDLQKSEYTDVLPVPGEIILPQIHSIPVDAWDGITLSHKIIPLFRKGEIITFSGKISGNFDTTTVVITNSKGESSQFSGDSRNGKFSIPVFFADDGIVQIGILRGKSGSYISYEGKVLSGTLPPNKRGQKKNTEVPKNFSAKHVLGKLFLEWQANENNLFHIQFRQNEVVKNIYVNGKNSVLVPVSVFNNFKTGEIQIFIRGAHSIDSSSFSLSSYFSPVAKIKISAFLRFTESVLDIPDGEIISASYEYIFGKKISVSGIVSHNISIGKVYVLTTNEELFEKNFSLTDIHDSSKKKFSLEFVPKKRDFYVLEISDKGGRALFVLPIAPKGTFPIIPNDFDKKSKTNVKIDSLVSLRRINAFRKEYGRKSLKSDSVIAELAQVRAEDMKNRDYFSHITPGGKNVNDFRSDFGIQVPLSENIAINSQSGLDATYSLEYSPTHRKNLLDTSISRVGIGLEEKDDGSVILVQLFGVEKLSEEKLLEMQKKFSEEILKVNKNIMQSSVLQKMTQQWAQIMAEKRDAKFEFSSGEKWEDLLDTYRIQRTTHVFVGSFPSQKVISEFIQKELAKGSSGKFYDVVSPTKKTFGISLALSEEGILFLCIVGEE